MAPHLLLLVAEVPLLRLLDAGLSWTALTNTRRSILDGSGYPSWINPLSQSIISANLWMANAEGADWRAKPIDTTEHLRR